MRRFHGLSEYRPLFRLALAILYEFRQGCGGGKEFGPGYTVESPGLINRASDGAKMHQNHRDKNAWFF
jgi:hypothetical protein